MGEGKKIPVPVVVIGVVLALGLAVFMGVKSFSPPPVAPMTSAEQETSKQIEAIVKRSNGDISKVNDEDRATLQKIAGGFAGKAYDDVKKRMGK